MELFHFREEHTNCGVYVCLPRFICVIIKSLVERCQELILYFESFIAEA